MPHMGFGGNYGYHGNCLSGYRLYSIWPVNEKLFHLCFRVSRIHSTETLTSTSPFAIAAAREPPWWRSSQEAVSDQSPTLNISDVCISIIIIIIIVSQCPNNSLHFRASVFAWNSPFSSVYPLNDFRDLKFCLSLRNRCVNSIKQPDPIAVQAWLCVDTRGFIWACLRWSDRRAPSRGRKAFPSKSRSAWAGNPCCWTPASSAWRRSERWHAPSWTRRYHFPYSSCFIHCCSR